MELDSPNKNELILLKKIIQLEKKIEAIQDEYIDGDTVELIANRIIDNLEKKGYIPREEVAEVVKEIIEAYEK